MLTGRVGSAVAQRSLRDASFVVAGATGGLGRALARELSGRGARLTLTARDPVRLRELADTLATPTCWLSADLRDVDAGPAIVAAAIDRFGSVDGIVNAAGIVGFGSLADTDPVAIEELFLVNVLGALWLARAAIPALTASRGVLVNLSAVVAERPLAGMAAYSATKAALTAADHALARELRAAGITVLDVRPPHTETGLATRPIVGTAPALPAGLDPAAVAARIVDALAAGDRDLPSTAFAA